MVKMTRVSYIINTFPVSPISLSIFSDAFRDAVILVSFIVEHEVLLKNEIVIFL